MGRWYFGQEILGRNVVRVIESPELYGCPKELKDYR